VRTIGSKGAGAGQFTYPLGVALDGAGNIVVADHANHRVQVLRYSDGSHVRTIGSHGKGNGQFYCPCGVLIDGEGRIIVSDCSNHRIQVLQ
jgi:tripartite motif-containing protein 71